MPIDSATIQSPGWWMQRLLKKLVAQRPAYELLDSYYTGQAAIPQLAVREVREAYRRLMALAGTNYAELVVEAVRERMMPVGFRTGAEPDGSGDSEAWRIWQANSLDADSALVHRGHLSIRDSYVIVGGVDPDTGAPLITPEDAREVVTDHDPRRRRRTRAALKVFADDVDGVFRIYLYLPGFVFRAVKRLPTQVADEIAVVDESIDGWEWEGWDQLSAPVVPVVRFSNRANMYGAPRGEFETHLPILDRINYTILTRLEIATMQAFRQRAIKGVPAEDEDGEEIDYRDIFRSGPDALWVLPETAEMWESGQVDLGPIRQAVRDDVQDLAAVTRTPLFYLTPEANNGSAEGASLAREGLVFKTQDRIVQAGESWEQVMSLAFLFAGDTERAARGDMEVLWAPPERSSLAERADAASKLLAAGVPWRTVMTDVMGYSPQQVDRMESERAAEQLAQIAGGDRRLAG